MKPNQKYLVGDIAHLHEQCNMIFGDGNSLSPTSLALFNEMILKTEKEILFQKKRKDYLLSKKSIQLRNAEVLGEEHVLKLNEMRIVMDANIKLKALSDDIKSKDDIEKQEYAKVEEEIRSRPSVQQVYAEEVNEIQTRLDAHSTRSKALIEENNRLRGEFKEILGSRDVKDSGLMEKLKEIDEKYSDAVNQQQTKLMQIKSNVELSEKYAKDIKTFEKQESLMKEQLVLYSSKFEEFQGELTKSNAIFTKYKGDMDAMQSVIQKLENEKAALTAKYAQKLLDVRQIEANERASGETTRLTTSRAKLSKQLSSLNKLIDTFKNQKVLMLAKVASEEAEAASCGMDDDV